MQAMKGMDEMQKRVWVIDDEQAICWALKKALVQSGYTVETFPNAEEAIGMLKTSPMVDAIMLDMRMPGMDGFQATRLIKKQCPKVPVIMMTAFGDLSSAIQAMDLDVFEYLTKPFDLLDGLKAVSKAITSTANSTALADTASDSIGVSTLVGSSAAMQQVYKQVAIASHSDIPVLVSAPVGFEMEAVASAIHRNGRRAENPFMAFAPIAIPPIALATQLLGTVQPWDAKAGSVFLRSGAFELAGEGTLYIDEVSDLTLSLQAQLLRVLEQREYSRLGDSAALPCAARIIASTTRNLKSLVAEGDFLEELRQKLGVFTIELEPLAQRREDILPIVNSILRSNSQNRAMELSEAASAWLVSRNWPGNIRELRNAIDRAVLATRGTCIDVEDFSEIDQTGATVSKVLNNRLLEDVKQWTLDHLQQLDAAGVRLQGAHDEDRFGTMYDDFLSMIEPALLTTMMEACHRNRALIAAQLGMHRSTLRQKMRRYDIE